MVIRTHVLSIIHKMFILRMSFVDQDLIYPGSTAPESNAPWIYCHVTLDVTFNLSLMTCSSAPAIQLPSITLSLGLSVVPLLFYFSCLGQESHENCVLRSSLQEVHDAFLSHDW